MAFPFWGSWRLDCSARGFAKPCIRQHGKNELRETPPDFLLQPPIPLNVTMLTGFHRAP